LHCFNRPRGHNRVGRLGMAEASQGEVEEAALGLLAERRFRQRVVELGKGGRTKLHKEGGEAASDHVLYHTIPYHSNRP